MEEEITWERMVKQEPRLQELLNEAKDIKDSGGEYFCANGVWYGNFKQRMSTLVGCAVTGNVPDFMSSSKAYDMAYDKVYHSLPDCRNCSCIV